MIGFGRKILIFTLFFVISSGAAFAQMYNPNQYSNPVIQKMYYNQMITTKAIGGLIQGHMLKAGSKTGRKNTATRARRDPLLFKPANVTVVSDEELDQIVKNPAEKKELEDFFNNCLKLYTTTAGKDKYPYNDLAYAFNYYVVNNYHIYNNVFEGIEKYSTYDVLDYTKVPNYVYASREQAVYKQFREVLASNPAVGKLTDAEKEKFTAQMAIMTNVPWFIYDAAVKAKNREAIENARKMAGQNLENLFGTSAENISIGDAGITIRGN